MPSIQLVATVVALALTSGLATAAEAPFDFDKASGRLAKNVVPLDYDIAVVPDAAARTFTGIESVSLRFRTATDKVVFNTLNLTLSNVRLDGQPVARVGTDNAAQLTTLTLAAAAAAGQHTLTLSYSGVIETRPQGLFVQPYSREGGGGQGLLLTTQMESTDARRMFPCWDEPAFRATFALTATVPADWATVGNMPVAKREVHGKLATTTFERSPRMPSYLVEFTAGDVREVGAQRGKVHFGVWAVAGRESEGATALANAEQILADYDDYFGYPYPLPKLDSIAIPGGFSGAMENWGAITYTDETLLLSKNSSLANAQDVYATQAHEMAHQWNGDLVTMGWWDDLWLNESFASWMAAKETDRRKPTWKWWESEDATKEDAMEADARTSSHAIQVHVTDELQAANAFDPTITYNKGQAVLRMLEAYLGPDTFRDGIRRYIKARAFSNATTADLWDALSAASGRQVGRIAADWTEQAGFPLVSVAAACDAGKRTISLSQRRFFLSAPADRSLESVHWSVPLQIRVGATAAAQPLLLTHDGQSLAAGSCQQPLSVDAGAIGFYRVSYDASALAANTRAFGTLPDGDRIALLDDQWALVQAHSAPLASYLALAERMGTDLDARAWRQIAGALGTIEYDERGTPGHAAFAAYARSLLEPVASRLGWDARAGETPDLQALRRTVIEDLGLWGDPRVISEAQRRFAAFVHQHSAIAPDDQSMILNVVGLHADAATFEELHTLARESHDESEKHRLYTALAGVRDPQLGAQAAKIALAPEIPPQAVQLRLGMFVTLHKEQPQLAWSTFSANVGLLLSPFGNVAPLIEAQYVPQIFWNSMPPEQMHSWLKAHVRAGMGPQIEKGMEGARFRLTQKQALVPEADAYLAARAPHA
ncbi:MAG: M1 family metallopeptidase [Steroidobacteraceae bacterium]